MKLLALLEIKDINNSKSNQDPNFIHHSGPRSKLYPNFVRRVLPKKKMGNEDEAKNRSIVKASDIQTTLQRVNSEPIICSETESNSAS